MASHTLVAWNGLRMEAAEEHPIVKMPTNVLDLHPSSLILKAESDHSSGGFADIHNGGRSIPTAGVFGAVCTEEVDLFPDLQVCSAQTAA